MFYKIGMFVFGFVLRQGEEVGDWRAEDEGRVATDTPCFGLQTKQ